jgi:site-specific recombinase XerD
MKNYGQKVTSQKFGECIDNYRIVGEIITNIQQISTYKIRHAIN